MPLIRPFPIDKAFPNAIDLRKAASAIYPREGVFPDPVTIAAAGIAFANGGWNIGARPFGANLKRGGAPYSRAYGSAQIANDSQATAWTIDAAPTSGVRLDRLWVRATDPTQAEALTTPAGETVPRAVPVFGVTPGTPNLAPLPAGAYEIATASVPAGAASAAGVTITNTYDFANVLGGTIYARTLAKLNATPGTMAGDTGYAEGAFYFHDGTGWRPVAGAPDQRKTFDSGTIAHGATITTFTFPAVAYATEVVLEYIGQVGNASASSGTYIPAFTTAGGALVESPVGAYGAAAGQWIAVPRDAVLTLPANTTAVVSVKSASSQNGIWRGSVVARRTAV